MNIGFLGLGKLGLPVALAVESKGHTVFGWDASPERRAAIAARSVATPEPGVHELLANSTLQLRAPALLATASL